MIFNRLCITTLCAFASIVRYAEMAEAAPSKTGSEGESRNELYEQALEQLVNAKDAYVAGFSESHPKLAQPWESIAKVQLSLHRLVEAHDAASRAIAIREKVVPVDPSTGARPFNKDLDAAYKLLKSVEAKQ